MQQFTQKYTLVHFIKDLPIGFEYEVADWPLHVTLADTFAIDDTPSDLLTDIKSQLASTYAVVAHVTRDEWFGLDKNVHVVLLDKTSAMQNQHDAIVKILNNHGVKFNNPEYTSVGYVPHSTVQKSGQLHVGDDTIIDSVTLVDMFPDEDPYRRRVLGTVHFASIVQSN